MELCSGNQLRESPEGCVFTPTDAHVPWNNKGPILLSSSSAKFSGASLALTTHLQCFTECDYS